MGSGEAEVVAQRVGQQPPSGYGDVVADAVDVQAHVVERLSHEVIFLAAATTRAVSTRTSWAR